MRRLAEAAGKAGGALPADINMSESQPRGRRVRGGRVRPLARERETAVLTCPSLRVVMRSRETSVSPAPLVTLWLAAELPKPSRLRLPERP